MAFQQAVVLGDGSRVLHYFRPVVEKGGDVPVGHVVEKPLVPMHEAQVLKLRGRNILFFVITADLSLGQSRLVAQTRPLLIMS